MGRALAMTAKALPGYYSSGGLRMTGDVMVSSRPVGEGPPTAGPSPEVCSRGCPIHVPGQSALAGALLGAIGGVIAGLVEGLVTPGYQPGDRKSVV